MRTENDRKRVRKRTRKRRLRYLRQRLARTTSLTDRQRLIAKIHRVSSAAPVPDR